MRSVDQSRIHSRECLVGLSGLEPPTSRLSGGCSNQLSYKPVDLFGGVHSGGDDGIRTHDPLLAGQVLSQLSYTPVWGALGERRQMQGFRSRPEVVLRTTRGREREEKKRLNKIEKIRRILSSFSFPERTVFQLSFPSSFALFRPALRANAQVSAPTYLPVLLPAKYFRLSGA